MTGTSTPILSVLVPTYNYGAFVAEALRSVLEQREPGIEIVVVDDGSTDDTPARMREFSAHAAVRYVRQVNAGPSAARNHAMSLARGRYLMFLDADDLLYDGCLRTTLGFLERHEEVGFFFTNYDIFDEEGIVEASGVDGWKVFRSLAHREVEPGGWIFTESLAPVIIRVGGFMHTSGLTIRRDVAEATGPFREGFSYGEDDEFYARAAYRCTAGYVDRVLSRKRNHASSLIHDPRHAIRNAAHVLALCEIQREEYAGDPRIQAILTDKIRACAISYAWALLQDGRAPQARSCVRKYLRRYPFSLALHKLGLRALLARP